MIKNVGIITDSALFLNLNAELLRKNGYNSQVHVMQTFSQIEECLNNNTIDLFLIDGALTNMSSMEVIHLLRLQKLTKSPVWLFPEVLTDSYFRRVYSIGVNRIIKKPFDPYELYEEVINVLNA